MVEPRINRNTRMRRLRRERKKAGLCLRCGLDNDRLPKNNCSLCAVKTSFEHQVYREKRNICILKELRSLKERVGKLEEILHERTR